MKVKVEQGETFDQALKRFNRMIQMSGIIDQIKDRKSYKKPSDVKRERNKLRDAVIRKHNRRVGM